MTFTENVGVFRPKPSEADGESRGAVEEKVGVFRPKPSEADGESPGAYFP